MFREEGTESPKTQRLKCTRRPGWLEGNGQGESGRKLGQRGSLGKLIKSLLGQDHTDICTFNCLASLLFVIVWKNHSSVK